MPSVLQPSPSEQFSLLLERAASPEWAGGRMPAPGVLTPARPAGSGAGSGAAPVPVPGPISGLVPGLVSVPFSAPGVVPVSVPTPPRPGPAVLPDDSLPAARKLRPESLHPSLWLGHQIGRHAEDALPSGFPVLDAQLPGGGWPRRVLTEVLLPHSGVGEIRLLAPSLAGLQRDGRLVMMFDPPEGLSGWALCELGFDVQQLLIIQTRTRVLPGADSLWALEQALRSGHVGAVMAWLPPRLRAERLRRLQLAAHAHDGPAFVFRETSASQRPTAAPLRLALKAAGADVMSLRVLKRRGPPLEKPLQLALPPVLPAPAQARAAALRAGGLARAAFVDLAA